MASHAKPSTRPGQLGQAFAAPERPTVAASRPRRDQRDLMSGAVRGLMVSPWFAAGAGFVIAAGAFIYAPHASLSFGNEVIGRTPCTVAGCAVPQKVPTMAGGATGLITPPPSPSSSSHTPRHAAHTDSDSAPDFTYTVQQHGSGMFQITFTISSKQAIGNWKLSFDILGATDLSVTGATWASSGTDGGTASGSAAGSTPSSSPSPSQAPGGGQSDVVSFVVTGKGAPTVAPSHCSFNGSACQFTEQD